MNAAPPPRTHRRRTRRNGFIIVAVLWILAALATLASVYAIYVNDTAVAFSVHDDRLRSEAIVKAGLELTAYRLSFPTDSRPSFGTFAFRTGLANVDVDYRSEAARIDLNAAPKELLAGLFGSLGTRPNVAETYAERIVGWRTAPAEGQDAEMSAYRTAGIRYPPRGGRFPHVAELSLVMGLPEALVEQATPFLTVYSGLAQVNAMEAAPQVLAALPGMAPDRLHAILVQRAATPQNGQLVSALLGTASSHATVEGSRATRVLVRIAFDDGRRSGSEAVILMSDQAPDPYRVLSWRDLLDEPLQERPRAGAR
jgi:general secretion pathway protein K